MAFYQNGTVCFSVLSFMLKFIRDLNSLLWWFLIAAKLFTHTFVYIFSNVQFFVLFFLENAYKTCPTNVFFSLVKENTTVILIWQLDRNVSNYFKHYMVMCSVLRYFPLHNCLEQNAWFQINKVFLTNNDNPQTIHGLIISQWIQAWFVIMINGTNSTATAKLPSFHGCSVNIYFMIKLRVWQLTECRIVQGNWFQLV